MSKGHDSTQPQSVGEERNEQDYMTIPDFAHKMARAESTIRRLVAQEVIATKHDGRTVRIPYAKGKAQYDEYMDKRDAQYRAANKQQDKSIEPQPREPKKKSYSESLVERVWDDQKFLVKDISPTAPEQPSESGD